MNPVAGKVSHQVGTRKPGQSAEQTGVHQGTRKPSAAHTRATESAPPPLSQPYILIFMITSSGHCWLCFMVVN